MGNVQSDSQELLNFHNSIKSTLTTIATTKTRLRTKYEHLGGSWKDSKYRELGNVVQECNSALNSIERTLSETQKYLFRLIRYLQEYEQVNLGSTSGNATADVSYTVGAQSYGGSLRSLEKTSQTFENVFLNGRNCTVFDHPFVADSGRICNQGSAYPTGPQNTCGCCSSGTIVNKAGGNTNEHDIVALAWDNGLCDNDGFTSAQTISDLLNISGVPSHITTGTDLDGLAEKVEHGYGVIIAVDIRSYLPNEYARGGHAIVLESVVRDAETGNILEYIVVDSNGDSTTSAVRRIPYEQLEEAFHDLNCQSITTDNIIW